MLKPRPTLAVQLHTLIHLGNSSALELCNGRFCNLRGASMLDLELSEDIDFCEPFSSFSFALAINSFDAA